MTKKGIAKRLPSILFIVHLNVSDVIAFYILGTTNSANQRTDMKTLENADKP
ncbi:MAG: hypothetical protein ACTS7E_00440 [Arsenophonus sp. NC-CH8-MAG3]